MTSLPYVLTVPRPFVRPRDLGYYAGQARRMTLLLTTLSNVLPLFVLIFLGVILRRSSMINEEFVSTSSKRVFRIALPVMVFRRLSQVDTVPAELFAGIGLFAGVTVVVVGLLWFLLRRLPGPQSAAAVQGAFRGSRATAS